jgi:peroxiredoxin
MLYMTPEPDLPPQQQRAPRLGLAVTALVLGLASIGLSIVVIGGLIAVAGLVLAVVHLVRRPEQPRGMAFAGLTLSLVGFVASAGFGFLYYSFVDDIIGSMANGGEAQKWIGRESPDFTVTTLDGQTFKLSDFRGKRVVVDIWETWCGPCIKEIPHFNQLRTSIPEDDLELIGISSEKESVLMKFLGKHKMLYRVASAENLPTPYSDVHAIPTTFFIDRNGIIQSVLVGYRNFDVLKKHSTASDYENAASLAPVNAQFEIIEK